MKIAGVSLWIWLAGIFVSAAAAALVVSKLSVSEPPGRLPLEIVKEDVWRSGRGYEVRGEIYNPRKEPVRNVRISYDLKGSYRGSKSNVGVVAASIKYVPPGETIDFTAVGATKLMIEGFVIDEPKGKIDEESTRPGN